MATYKFDKSRCRILSKCNEVMKDCKGIVYWMHRDYRVQDNWAMLFAQKLARKNLVPLSVCVFGKPEIKLVPTERHYKFLMDGLKEVADECTDLNIHFHFINASPESLVDVVRRNSIGAVVCDFFPLRKPMEWLEFVKNSLPKDVPLIQVDAHNIVPAWEASGKQEIAARTIRPKITKQLDKYLVDFPKVTEHEFKGEGLTVEEFPFDEALEKFEGVRCLKTEPIAWAKGGTKNGLQMLKSFLTGRLKAYGTSSNDPSKDVCSNLSPWIHFGQISAQRCALNVKNLATKHKASAEKFLEELIVRKELSDNFCFYNPNYDNLDGAEKWAKETLNVHRKDKRVYVYTRQEFERAETHDEIWNAAQVQLVQEGKIHGYMRMYWCKKILEWTKSPEEAIEIGLYLNDTYSLDGSDPNGFVGVMWSICGVHDHGWKEREVFGKIRWMVDSGLKRKFDIDAYVVKCGSKLKSVEYNKDDECEPKVKKQKV